MWVGLALLFVGFWGYVLIRGWDISLSMLAVVPFRSISNYTFAAMPLFLMMGIFVTNTGFASDLFKSAHQWIGQLRGGLAMATSIASAILGVITDSMVAVITLGKAAVPEMRKYKYDDSLANASVAGGASLASLVPPSIGFIMYGMLTGESVGQLYIAAVIPSIFLTAAMLFLIGFMARINPKLAPPGPKTSFRAKVVSLKFTWGVAALFILIIVGIYAGVFTPTEAGAVGAFGALVIGLIGRRFTKKSLIDSILETAQMTAMIVVLVAGAFVFANMMTVSKIPFMLANFVAGLEVSRYVVMAVIFLIYIIMGMFSDIMPCIIVTIPILFPVIETLGFDPIWFGVVMCLLAEMGMITPPIGMNVFILSGITGTPINVIFRGVWPFVLLLLFSIVILTIFPQIVLWLPSTM
jgi:tripartite ATP-independent transporter DctM subunit